MDQILKAANQGLSITIVLRFYPRVGLFIILEKLRSLPDAAHGIILEILITIVLPNNVFEKIIARRKTLVRLSNSLCLTVWNARYNEDKIFILS